MKQDKLPTKIGDCIDAALKARAARQALQGKMDVLEKEERRITEHMIQTFENAQIEGAKGKRGSASLVEKDVPKVLDKEAFGRWIYKNGAWDCLYGRAVEEACQLRWEDPKVRKIDGIEKYHVKKIILKEK
jgi:hypothetical protein